MTPGFLTKLSLFGLHIEVVDFADLLSGCYFCQLSRRERKDWVLSLVSYTLRYEYFRNDYILNMICLDFRMLKKLLTDVEVISTHVLDVALKHLLLLVVVFNRLFRSVVMSLSRGGYSLFTYFCNNFR
jgi:hypothetical protein